jgi:transcriptional regulator GlxA family with amidase domain
MKKLSVLVPSGDSNLISIVTTYNLFLKANERFQSLGRPPVFQVRLVGCSAEEDVFGGLFCIRPHESFQAVRRTDLMIIPATREEFGPYLKKNKPLAEWITRQYKLGAEIASLCTGAFLLASTGLLKGRKCSTHWMAASSFRELFPDVRLMEDRLITAEKGIYTNGGGFSFLNLLLYLIEKYYDRETAIYCSKVFEIEMDRNTQSPFIIFTGQKGHGDQAIQDAQLYMERHAGEEISVDDLASRVGVGRRNFDRRFRKATANTPAEYLQRVRVETAKKCLETGRETVAEIMYSVGYSDSRAFRRTFKRVTGLSPVEYRGRFTH